MGVRILVLTILFVVIPTAVWAGPAVPRNSDSIATVSPQDHFVITGTVHSIDRSLAEFGVLEHTGERYTIQTMDSDFLIGERRGSFTDLQSNASVTVYGREIRRGIVSADVVIVAVLEDTYVLPYAFEEVGRIVTARGIVETIDAGLGRILLRGERGLLDVNIIRETDIREAGRRRSIDNISPGTFLVVTGRLETITTITAHTINIGGPDPGTALFDTILTGVVVRRTGIIDRTLLVRTLLGDKRVEVPRGADIRISGLPASAHDIRRGDQVRAVGRWSGGVFIVRQMLVTEVRRWEEVGRIIQIDRNIITIRVGTTRYTVYARNAEIRRDGRSIRLRDLRVGDSVTVRGERRDNIIYAESIDVRR